MPNNDPPSYDIELPTISLSARSPSDSSAHPQVPLHVEVGTSQSRTSPTDAVTNSSTLTPPDSVYPSPFTHPPPINDTPTVEPPTSTDNENDVDPGFLEYTIAHDRGGTAIARRPPEAYPSDLLSLRSGHGPPESLPAYGENAPPGYTRAVESLRKEPQTLARYLFRFGFIFPLFWLFGALLVVHPMSPLARGAPWRPDDAFVAWYNQNVLTEEDKMEFNAKMQRIQRKWSKRCGMAFALFLCLCLAVGVTIFGLLKVSSMPPN